MLDASLASFEKLSIVATVEESSLASDDITIEPHVSLLDPMNIFPKPFTISPEDRLPTVVNEDVTILDPNVVPLNTVVPAMSYPLPLATDNPEDDLIGPPSPLTKNVTLLPLVDPLISNPPPSFESAGVSLFKINVLFSKLDDEPVVTKLPSTCKSPNTLTLAKSVTSSAVVIVDALFILNCMASSALFCVITKLFDCIEKVASESAPIVNPVSFNTPKVPDVV